VPLTHYDTDNWLTRYVEEVYNIAGERTSEGAAATMARTATTRVATTPRVRRKPVQPLALQGTSPTLAQAINRALRVRGDTLREALLTRWLTTATDALSRVSRSKLGEAAAASTNVEAVLRVLEAPEMLNPIAPDLILAAARARGLEARQQLLNVEGGPWTAEQVASYLRVSRQSVDKRRKAGRLLALTVGRRGYLYPSWQFTRQGILSGWETVLTVLAPHDAWSQMIFMLSPNDRLDNKRPIDALRQGKVDNVKTAASVFGEHGAA